MRHKSRLPGPPPNATPASPSACERLVRDIRRVTRKHYSAEDKIEIVLDGILHAGDEEEYTGEAVGC
mgnify:CR=1 FL=1